MRKFWYYFLNFTWGLPVQIIAAVVGLALLVTGHKPEMHGPCVHFKAGGRNWGGFSLGLLMVTDQEPNDSLCNHEFGHTIQCSWFGLLYLVIVALPSAIRYWYREILYRKNKVKYWSLPPYDSIWFEGQATLMGNKYIDCFKK